MAYSSELLEDSGESSGAPRGKSMDYSNELLENSGESSGAPGAKISNLWQGPTN